MISPVASSILGWYRKVNSWRSMAWRRLDSACSRSMTWYAHALLEDHEPHRPRRFAWYIAVSALPSTASADSVPGQGGDADARAEEDVFPVQVERRLERTLDGGAESAGFVRAVGMVDHDHELVAPEAGEGRVIGQEVPQAVREQRQQGVAR